MRPALRIYAGRWIQFSGLANSANSGSLNSSSNSNSLANIC